MNSEQSLIQLILVKSSVLGTRCIVDHTDKITEMPFQLVKRQRMTVTTKSHMNTHTLAA